MVQYVYDVCIIDVCRIVQIRIVVIAGFQFSNAFVRQRFYRFFRIEVNRVRWVGFYVGWFLFNYYAVNVQRIFVDAVVFRVEARNVERIVRNVIIVVNVLFGLEVDDIVGILNNCIFRRVRFQVVWIGIVYIVVFADQLFQFVVLFYFREAYYRLRFGV